MATILKGDCLTVMKGFADKSIDCFICDLPYGCLSGRAIGKAAEDKKCFSGNTNGCTWDVKIDLAEFWKQVKRLAKNDHTPVLMFCNTKFGYDLIKSNESWFRYDIVWAKTNAVGFLRANIAPMAAHEMIYVFSKKGAYYKRIDDIGDYPAGGGGRSAATFMPINEMPNIASTEAGRRCFTSVLKVANKKTKGGHPTAKPVELYEWLIRRYVCDGGVVLDPTAGSFNCVRAAKAIGVKAIGIEKDTDFFNKAISLMI
jgi:site-specific DNA-methyltransferase (adenine-specific)